MSTKEEPIILFDLANRPPQKCWSLNPWKTRFLLNYKGLDYRTEWVEYPDLKERLEGRVAPHKEGAAYTSPTVRLPDGTYISDSRVIAAEIEKRYPQPSVHLDSPMLPKLEAAIEKLRPPLSPVIFSQVPANILNEASHPYWYKTRGARAGMPLDKFAAEYGGQKAWDGAEAGIDQVTALLKEDPSGPFFMGKQISYADFVWGGFLIFFQRISVDDFEMMTKTMGADSDVHMKLMLALSEWSMRDDR